MDDFEHFPGVIVFLIVGVLIVICLCLFAWATIADLEPVAISAVFGLLS